MSETPVHSPEVLRLHIGGTSPRPGWKIFNIQPAPHVDFSGTCTDLSQFADNSVEEVYASHVYEHLGYQQDLPRAFAEVHRVLRPAGLFKISVPDLEILCQLFLQPGLALDARYHVMRMMFGGQIDPFDFHQVGLDWQILTALLGQARFTSARRVASFDLFEDCSSIVFSGSAISLNVEAVK